VYPLGMAIRFTYNGQAYEADTPQEAVALRKELEAMTQPTPVTPAGPATSRATRQPWLTPPVHGNGSRSPAEMIFREAVMTLNLLKEAKNEGIDTELMVTTLALKSAKSLPPIIGAWKKRAAGIGLNLDDLLRVEKGYKHGKPSTTYALTERGLEVLGG
jgi:hypothetical protein